MLIKNNSEKDISFEGTTIKGGETKEVIPEIGQKLLALYWHNPLELVEEKQEEPIDKIIEDIPEETSSEETSQDEASQETPQEEITQEETEQKTEQFVCEKCGKSFTKKVGLVAHQRFCK